MCHFGLSLFSKHFVHVPFSYGIWTYIWHMALVHMPHSLGFPGGSDGKEFACNARDLGSICGSGISPGEGNGNPLQYSYLGNPMDRGPRQAKVHGVAKDLDMTEQLTHFHISHAQRVLSDHLFIKRTLSIKNFITSKAQIVSPSSYILWKSLSSPYPNHSLVCSILRVFLPSKQLDDVAQGSYSFVFCLLSVTAL